MSAQAPRVVALVVNYHSTDHLQKLIPVLEHEPDVSRTIVVDNSPSDGARAAVLAEHAGVVWINSPANVGFAKAVNLGLMEVGADDHILLINPDCMPLDGAVGAMVRHLDANPECGIVAPLTLHPSRHLKFLAAGEQPTTRSLLNHYLGLSAAFPDRGWARGWHLRTVPHGDRVQSVGWASGACLLIRERARREVGGLSEEWFMYAEDMEYCLRTTRAGWTIHHTPSAVVTHEIGGSTSGTSTRWVSVLLDYNRRYLSARPVVAWVARYTLAVGFAARAGVAGLRGARSMRNEDAQASVGAAVRQNLRWARRALTPQTSGLDRP